MCHLGGEGGTSTRPCEREATEVGNVAEDPGMCKASCASKDLFLVILGLLPIELVLNQSPGAGGGQSCLQSSSQQEPGCSSVLSMRSRFWDWRRAGESWPFSGHGFPMRSRSTST